MDLETAKQTRQVSIVLNYGDRLQNGNMPEKKSPGRGTDDKNTKKSAQGNVDKFDLGVGEGRG